MTRAVWLTTWLALTLGGSAHTLGQEGGSSADAINRQWPTYQEVALPAAPEGGWLDLVLTPSVFDGARLDLGDLRLYDAAGHEVHYVLRVRRPEFTDVALATKEFNRGAGPNASSELTLDLGESPPEHNELEVPTPGLNFRRRVELEGSDDSQQWLKLLEKDLLRFEVGDDKLIDRRLVYPPSRFRYLRLRVFQDPQVDHEPVEIGEVTLHRKVELPGEFVTLPATLGPREAVRAPGGPGSAWIIDLGANNQPCETLLAIIGDAEFARDYLVEASGPPEANEPFVSRGDGQWRRRAGEERKPLEAELSAQPARRLRLVVTDYRNPPLDVQSVEFRAPARQIVFANTGTLVGPLRLYYGNPKGEPPHYDLERNLPPKLDPPPTRLVLGPRQDNPQYVPVPPALSERWPWLIYVVLGTACLALGVVLLNLGRTAVVRHDAQQVA